MAILLPSPSIPYDRRLLSVFYTDVGVMCDYLIYPGMIRMMTGGRLDIAVIVPDSPTTMRGQVVVLTTFIRFMYKAILPAYELPASYDILLSNGTAKDNSSLI